MLKCPLCLVDKTVEQFGTLMMCNNGSMWSVPCCKLCIYAVEERRFQESLIAA